MNHPDIQTQVKELLQQGAGMKRHLHKLKQKHSFRAVVGHIRFLEYLIGSWEGNEDEIAEQYAGVCYLRSTLRCCKEVLVEPTFAPIFWELTNYEMDVIADAEREGEMEKTRKFNADWLIEKNKHRVKWHEKNKGNDRGRSEQGVAGISRNEISGRRLKNINPSSSRLNRASSVNSKIV